MVKSLSSSIEDNKPIAVGLFHNSLISLLISNEVWTKHIVQLDYISGVKIREESSPSIFVYTASEFTKIKHWFYTTPAMSKMTWDSSAALSCLSHSVVREAHSRAGAAAACDEIMHVGSGLYIHFKANGTLQEQL